MGGLRHEVRLDGRRRLRRDRLRLDLDRRRTPPDVGLQASPINLVAVALSVELGLDAVDLTLVAGPHPGGQHNDVGDHPGQLADLVVDRGLVPELDADAGGACRCGALALGVQLRSQRGDRHRRLVELARCVSELLVALVELLAGQRQALLGLGAQQLGLLEALAHPCRRRHHVVQRLLGDRLARRVGLVALTQRVELVAQRLQLLGELRLQRVAAVELGPHLVRAVSRGLGLRPRRLVALDQAEGVIGVAPTLGQLALEFLGPLMGLA